MSCNIAAGRKTACKKGLGGQSFLYLFDKPVDTESFTLSADFSTTAGVNLAADSVFAFPLEGDNNSLEQSMVGDRNTGTRVNTQTLVASLKRMDAASHAQLNLLVAGYPQAVVVDRLGNHHVLGFDDGIDFTVVASTGSAKADMNGYTLTGVATEPFLGPILSETDASSGDVFDFLAKVDVDNDIDPA